MDVRTSYLEHQLASLLGKHEFFNLLDEIDMKDEGVDSITINGIGFHYSFRKHKREEALAGLLNAVSKLVERLHENPFETEVAFSVLCDKVSGTGLAIHGWDVVKQFLQLSECDIKTFRAALTYADKHGDASALLEFLLEEFQTNDRQEFMLTLLVCLSKLGFIYKLEDKFDGMDDLGLFGVMQKFTVRYSYDEVVMYVVDEFSQLLESPAKQVLRDAAAANSPVDVVDVEVTETEPPAEEAVSEEEVE